LGDWVRCAGNRLFEIAQWSFRTSVFEGYDNTALRSWRYFLASRYLACASTFLSGYAIMNALAQELDQHERPISEQYRIAANLWVDADGEARELEELKTTMLEQKKNMLVLSSVGKMPDSHAEREVKASDDWETYIRGMVHARTKANKLKVEMERLKMLEREIADRNNTIRAEMRMAGR
jgi:hypothetical protein